VPAAATQWTQAGSGATEVDPWAQYYGQFHGEDAGQKYAADRMAYATGATGTSP